jgi:hypothetical protein
LVKKKLMRIRGFAGRGKILGVAKSADAIVAGGEEKRGALNVGISVLGFALRMFGIGAAAEAGAEEAKAEGEPFFLFPTTADLLMFSVLYLHVIGDGDRKSIPGTRLLGSEWRSGVQGMGMGILNHHKMVMAWGFSGEGGSARAPAIHFEAPTLLHSVLRRNTRRLRKYIPAHGVHSRFLFSHKPEVNRHLGVGPSTPSAIVKIWALSKVG